MEDKADVAPGEYSPDKFEVSPNNIRYGHRTLVIKRVADALDEENPSPLSLDVVKTLVSRAIYDNRYSCSEMCDEHSVLWPESSEGEFKKPPFDIIVKNPHWNPIHKGMHKFKEGLFDVDNLDAMRKVAFEAMKNLDDKEKAEVTKWILQMHQIDLLDVSGLEFDSEFCSFVDQAQNRSELVGLIIDYLYDNAEQFHYKLPYESGAWIETRVDELVFAIDSKRLWKDMPEYLERQTNDDKVKKLLGIWIDQDTYPSVINRFRTYLESNPSENLERTGRMLLGENPDDKSIKFHTRLEEIYKLVDFENYPPNITATEHEIEMLLGLLRNGDVVMEKGCGTGRISNALAKKAKENGLRIKIIAFDSSEVNIIKARNMDETGEIQFFQGNWNSIPLQKESVDLIIDLGRNNTHVEHQKALEKSLEDPSRVLKNGGKIVVDWPDPNKGEYLENRIRYLHILQNLYVPVEPGNPEQLKMVSYVIDGPDKEGEKYGNLYNRYVPQIGTIEKTYNIQGFDIKEVGRQPIADWENSENIYFVATKTN